MRNDYYSESGLVCSQGMQIPFLSPTPENTGFGIRKPELEFTLHHLPKWKICGTFLGLKYLI